MAAKLQESNAELLESGVWAQMLSDSYGCEVATSMLLAYEGFLPPPPPFQRSKPSQPPLLKLPPRVDGSLPEGVPACFMALVQETKVRVCDKPQRCLKDRHCTRVLHIMLAVLQVSPCTFATCLPVWLVT